MWVQLKPQGRGELLRQVTCCIAFLYRLTENNIKFEGNGWENFPTFMHAVKYKRVSFTLQRFFFVSIKRKNIFCILCAFLHLHLLLLPIYSSRNNIEYVSSPFIQMRNADVNACGVCLCVCYVYSQIDEWIFQTIRDFGMNSLLFASFSSFLRM